LVASPPTVFLSYASADRERVRHLVGTLEAEGIDVWWDREIPAGRNYSEFIADQLAQSDCVVVAWSQRSVKSEWVCEEAERGKRRRILIPVLIDDVVEAVPLGFGLLQAIDLQSWKGDSSASEFRTLVEAILSTVGKSEFDKEAIPAQVASTRAPNRHLPVVFGLCAAALMTVGLALLSNLYLTKDFPSTAASAALVTAPAPLGILLGCLLAVGAIAASMEAPNWLYKGLILGFGFEALAKGLSLLGESSGRTVAGALFWIAGGVVALAAAILAIRPVRKQLAAFRSHASGPPPVIMAVLILLGALLVVVATFVPFNVAHPGGQRSVIDQSALGVEPLATAAAALVAVALLYSGGRRLAAGVLVALGIGSTLLWIRYAGVPVLQWINNHDGVASPRAGGFLGVAGGLLILLGGWGLVSSHRRRTSASAEHGHALSPS